MKKGILLLFFLISTSIFAQTDLSNIHQKKITVINDTIKIDSNSISPYHFKVLSHLQKEIDTAQYTVDFVKSLLIFKPNTHQNFTEITIQYSKYPDFLTKKYFVFDKKLIVPSTSNETQLYSLTTNEQKKLFKPFEGLNTAGNITRGLTVGNNQNGVVNSTLDLKIEGKISEKVTLRASIVDTNLPIQENGNTYKFNEFETVFMELSSEKWKVNAGDIYLNNNETNFLRFNKKVSGLGIATKIDNEKNEINTYNSAAVVKGKYKKIQFNGNEGNQGPYKLSDFNNSYILILSNTEQVYVNGLLLKRGEENDYIIDYNTNEITFNVTFPITANSRITAEYQYTDRVYTRFVTYNNIDFKTDNLKISGYFYNENDLKNQPLEQDLSNEKKQTLAKSGNDTNLMVSPSAYIDPFSEDKIQYKKTYNGTVEIYEYSTNFNDEVYNVSFTNVGNNLGDYKLKEVIATGKIYEYVGLNQGNYSSVTQLTAPDKLQISVLKATYQPSDKTNIRVETAFSNNDENLFSTIDDANNKGLATKIGIDQILFEKKWRLKTGINFDYINSSFKSIERINSIEFNRDWNIDITDGDQKLFNSALELSNKNNKITYLFEDLTFGDSFKGLKHQFFGSIKHHNLSVNFNNSLLSNETSIENGDFLRAHIQAKYNLKNSWYGVSFNSENNDRKTTLTNQHSPLSYKFNEYESFVGIGDSTKVFSQIGFNYRSTDSIQNNTFERVNKAKTFYLRSTLIQSKSSNLSTYINYRFVENANFKNETSLNSKLNYQQNLFNQFISLNTTYQTASGSMPQQDYTYIKTEPGQGFYTWIDYNNNGIKDLNEFEIAQFTDQASYLRIILPTLTYTPTYQNKFSQAVIINPEQWNSTKGLKKLMSHFFNQTYVLVDSKQKKSENELNLNPFKTNNNNVLGLNFNLNNSFYFNRGKKYYSTIYNFINSKNNSTNTIDALENKLTLSKLQFEHKLGDFWQFNFDFSNSKNETTSTNYSNRTYALKSNSYIPKLSYYYNENSYLAFFFETENKKNNIGNLESLQTQKIGIEVHHTNSIKNSLNADFNFFNNKFTGNSNSPVGYQMLEGLQPDKNFTWSLLFYRKINSYLNLNINYLGRKSASSNAIHTGSIQLKALF